MPSREEQAIDAIFGAFRMAGSAIKAHKDAQTARLGERMMSLLEADSNGYGDPQELVSVSKDLLKRVQEPLVYFALGKGLLRLKNFAEAESQFKTAASGLEGENKAGALFHLGRCYIGLDRKSDAIKTFTECIRLDPQPINALFARAQLLLDIDPDTALNDTNQLISLEPGDADNYWLRAMVHIAKGNPQLALADLDRAILLNPKDEQLHKSKAMLLETSGTSQSASVQHATAAPAYPVSSTPPKPRLDQAIIGTWNLESTENVGWLLRTMVPKVLHLQANGVARSGLFGSAKYMIIDDRTIRISTKEGNNDFEITIDGDQMQMRSKKNPNVITRYYRT
jgi:tetratricopeptide (TPR) repeat protein